MNLFRSRRKSKRLVNWYRKHVGYGAYAINCRGQPGKVIETEFYTSDLYGNGCIIQSLVDGAEGSCSYLHCRPQPINYQMAQRMAGKIRQQESLNEA